MALGVTLQGPPPIGHMDYDPAIVGWGVIGRDAEMASLETLLGDAASGPVGLLLEGEAGIGKTTLWWRGVELARQASCGLLSCRPAGSETPLSFAGLGDLFSGVSDEILAELPGPQRHALDVVPTRLGPDTARPAVTLNVDPPSGSQVEPGDEILFDVTAQEARSGLSWQTGVRDLRVKAIPGEDLVPQERADSSTPQPCNRKQWSLVTQGSYVVPDDPPPTFRICPIANDFAGNQNADTCATYHTGELWTGTYFGNGDLRLRRPRSHGNT